MTAQTTPRRPTLHSLAWDEPMGDEQVVLLTAGANINEEDEDGRTPLDCACAAGNAAIVKLLLERGARDLLSKDAVSKAGYSETIVALLEEARKKKKQAFPPEFTKATVLCLSEEARDGGARVRVWLQEREGWTTGSGSRWDRRRRRVYSAEEWGILVRRWEKDYPKIEKEHWHPYETVSYRCRQTNERGNIEYCWIETGEQLSSELKVLLGQKYADLFRVDRYGNVIANRLSDLSNKDSITFFDVDHAFPWSRGGRSIQENFVACQYAANRWAKSSTLLCMLTKEEMLRGISLKQLEALFRYCVEEKGGGKRNSTNSQRQLLVSWLTRTPMTGQSLSNFQETTAKKKLVKENGDPDGARLWNFFEDHFNNAATPFARSFCKVFAARARAAEAHRAGAKAFGEWRRCTERARVVELDRKLVAQDAEIASLRAALAERDGKLAERGTEIDSLRAKMASDDATPLALVTPSKS